MTRRTVHDLVSEAKAAIEELSVDQLRAEVEAGICTVVDIRDVRERIASGSIPGAVSAPRGMLEFWLDPESPYAKPVFQEEKRFLFYCNTGWRSALASKVAQDMGLERVCHLEGGFTAWTEGDAPVEAVERRK